MKVCIVVLSLIVAASAQRAPHDYPDQPMPYSFNYVAPGEEGSSSHQETGDGNGNVQGSYELSDVDGRYRIVEYVADANGFRANIRTNEPGTANANPADVTIESTADQGGVVVPPAQPRPQPQPPRVQPQPLRVQPQPPRVQPQPPRVQPQPPRPQPAGSGNPPGYVLVPVEEARRLNYLNN